MLANSLYMKKIYFIFIYLICCSNASSQLVKAIVDGDKNTFGYLEFKFIDPRGGNDKFTVGYPQPVNAKEFQVEIQDINLTRISDINLQFDAPVSQFLISYNKNSILILGLPIFSRSSLNNLSYYIFDLSTNKLSSKYTFSKELNLNDVILSSIEPIDNRGFIFSIVPHKKNSKIDLYAINNHNEKLWINHLTNSYKGKNVDIVFYERGSYKDIFGAIFSDDEKSINKKYGLLLINKNNGKEINRQLIDNSQFRYEPVSLNFMVDKIVLFGDLYLEKNKIDGKSTGIFMVTADMNGNFVERKNQTWEELKNNVDIENDGFVKNLGYFYSHEYIIDAATNHIIVPSEFFLKSGLGMIVTHLFFLDFDQNFNLVNTYRVFKNTTQYPFNSMLTNNYRAWGNSIKREGYFDYIFSSELDSKKGIAFYYVDVNREEGLIRKGEYSFGTVSYINGKFKNDKLKFTSKNPIGVLRSKPGYILLYEETKGNTLEKRIEKINY